MTNALILSQMLCLVAFYCCLFPILSMFIPRKRRAIPAEILGIYHVAMHGERRKNRG